MTTHRGLRALQYGVNIADTMRTSPSYWRRLEKYTKRGFAIALPGYLPSRAAKLRNSNYVHLQNYDMLLQVGPKWPHNQEIELDVSKFCGLRAARADHADVRVSSTQKGTSMQGIARLIALDSAKTVLPVNTPALMVCREHKKVSADDARDTGACVPVCAGRRGEYILLWGAHLPCPDSDDDESEDGLYMQTLLAMVYSLLDRHFRQECNESPRNEDAMWTGGVMQRLAKAMRSSDPTVFAFELASDHQASRIWSQRHILFVYDFCTCVTPFESLSFVRDAARSPLDSSLSEDDFFKKYGLPSKLTFEKRSLEEHSATNNCWQGVY